MPCLVAVRLQYCSAVLLLCIFAGVDLTPITDLSLFSTREQIDVAIRARAALVERLHQDLLLLRSHRNDLLSPVARLPNELLAEIFRLFVSEFWRHPRDCAGGLPIHTRPYQWLCISLVCRQWRTVVLGLVDLWVRVAMTDRDDCFWAILERSQDKPLTILPGSFDVGSGMDFKRFFHLVPVAGRIQHLSLCLTKRLLRDLADMRFYYGPEAATSNMPMLETMALAYPDFVNESHDMPPNVFWFISGAPLPRLRDLWIDGVYSRLFRDLGRPTLTRLRARLGDHTMRCSDWINFLEGTPLLEDLDLEFFCDPPTDSEMTPAERRIPMVHLRRCSFIETDPGILPAKILNHLVVPSDCSISTTVENEYNRMDHHVYIFTLETIGSKLSGATSFGGPRLPQSMLLSNSRYTTLAFWLSEDRGCAWARSYQKRGFDGERPMVSLAFRNTLSPEDEDEVLVMQALYTSILPLSNITSLTLELSADFGEDSWFAVRQLTQLQNLSLSDANYRWPDADWVHRYTLSQLSGTPPLFPHLRFLHLDSVRWHVHHSACRLPYSGEPLSVKLEEMLAARRDIERPIQQLELSNIRHFDRDIDLAWLEDTAMTQHPTVSWTERGQDSPVRDWCTICEF